MTSVKLKHYVGCRRGADVFHPVGLAGRIENNAVRSNPLPERLNGAIESENDHLMRVRVRRVARSGLQNRDVAMQFVKVQGGGLKNAGGAHVVWLA